MRWLIDECVDAALVALLRESGHDAVYMSDVAPRATDVEVMNRAHRESRLLLTEDKDFGDLVFRKARPVPASSCCASIRRDARTRGPDCWPPLTGSATTSLDATRSSKMLDSALAPYG